MMRPGRLSGEGWPDVVAPDDWIARAITVLGERDYLALVELDHDLMVLERHGRLADDIQAGANICDVLPPFFGMDEQIKSLRRGADRALEIPSVAIVRAGAPAPRLSYLVVWDSTRSVFTLAIFRSLADSDVSIELQQQVRRRILAETEIAAQAKIIEATNQTLMRVNRDLADFARIVSHDLKSPMRAMRYFADDLERSLTDPENDDPKAHLDRLRGQSSRMSSMLSGLLSYVRLERKDLAIELLDTGALVQGIVQSLHRPSGFEIVVSGTWPTIETLEAPLDLVVRNVVENAIKHHDRDSGRISVSGNVDGADLVIRVEDDGPGIEERFQSVMFQAFSRLNTDHDDGTGMGLTLVKRAVESVGGRLRVTSEPARKRGALFLISWPLAISTEK